MIILVLLKNLINYNLVVIWWPATLLTAGCAVPCFTSVQDIALSVLIQQLFVRRQVMSIKTIV